ncbi:MAG: aminodeoxychorismate synthase, component I, partial [Rhodanobacter sp.]
MICHSRRMDGRRDLLAPVAIHPERYPCLLQSVSHGTAQSRYDILFAFPGDKLTLAADGVVRNAAGQAQAGGFLHALDRAWKTERLRGHDDGLPFHGGWVLLLSYELAGEVEPGLALLPPPELPLALAVRCPAAVIVDHL